MEAARLGSTLAMRNKRSSPRLPKRDFWFINKLNRFPILPQNANFRRQPCFGAMAMDLQ
jgi:hypothetical protein